LLSAIYKIRTCFPDALRLSGLQNISGIHQTQLL